MYIQVIFPLTFNIGKKLRETTEKFHSSVMHSHYCQNGLFSIQQFMERKIEGLLEFRRMKNRKIVEGIQRNDLIGYREIIVYNLGDRSIATAFGF